MDIFSSSSFNSSQTLFTLTSSILTVQLSSWSRPRSLHSRCRNMGVAYGGYKVKCRETIWCLGFIPIRKSCFHITLFYKINPHSLQICPWLPDMIFLEEKILQWPHTHFDAHLKLKNKKKKVCNAPGPLNVHCWWGHYILCVNFVLYESGVDLKNAEEKSRLIRLWLHAAFIVSNQNNQFPNSLNVHTVFM